MTVITLKNISKAIQGVPILSGIDITLRKGEEAIVYGHEESTNTYLVAKLDLNETPDQET